MRHGGVALSAGLQGDPKVVMGLRVVGAKRQCLLILCQGLANTAKSNRALPRL